MMQVAKNVALKAAARCSQTKTLPLISPLEMVICWFIDVYAVSVITTIGARGSNMKFLKDITHRGDVGSSKKFWFNIACFTATVIIIKLAWQLCSEYGMDDRVFVCLFVAYLASVGGFEVIPKMLAMIIEFKTGKGTQNVANNTMAEQKTDS